VEFEERFASLERALHSVLPVIDWWYGRLPSEGVLPESVAGTIPDAPAWSASDEVDEGSLRLLHSTTTQGIPCIVGSGDRHSFRFVPPLPTGYSDIAACGRCGTRALIEPGGQTTPLPENSRRWSISRGLLPALALLVLTISLLACTDERPVRRPAAPAPAATQTAPTLTERVMWVAQPWCPPPAGCLAIDG
jgi:hypothetical protein